MNEITLVDNKIDLRVLPKPNKKQTKFLEYWLLPESETFSNAYQSAKKAGYADNYARVITGNVQNIEWVQEAKALIVKNLSPEHIVLGLQHKAINAKQDRDQIRAYELLAKIRGMFIERSQSEVNVTFSNSVPRPVVDSTATDSTV
jgi:hypothetical protein